MRLTIFILLFIVSLLADIGHLNFTFEGKVFDKTIRTIIQPLGVVPGIANITVRTSDDAIDSIKVKPVKWWGKMSAYPHLKAGPQGAPPSDKMEKVDGENNLFLAELWLMDFGAYNINLEFFKNNSREIINIPINSIATEIKPMSFQVSAMLFLLMLLLVCGAINIITIAYRESTIPINKSVPNKKNIKSKKIMVFSMVVILFILYVCNTWWGNTENLYRENLYVPMKNKVELINNGKQNILKILFTDELWLDGRIPDLIPDHGKIMHLYLINENFEQLCHLHPKRNQTNKDLFEVVLPDIERGKYYLYMDITFESGFTSTLINKINYETDLIPVDLHSNYLKSDKDDSYISIDFKHQLKWINQKNKFAPNEEIQLLFQAQNIAGVPTSIEPYIQMGGHGAILKKDHSVFIHIHPIGTISMASQELYNKNDEIESSGICYYGSPNDSLKTYFQNEKSMVNFPPLQLSKEGAYIMWVQIKTSDEVVTESFEFSIQ